MGEKQKFLLQQTRSGKEKGRCREEEKNREWSYSKEEYTNIKEYSIRKLY